MIINDIKDIVKDFKLSNSQLIWISSFLIVIILGLGSYTFFGKKDDSSDKNKILIENFTKLQSDYNNLVINFTKLEDDFNKEVDIVNYLSTNTDKRFVYVIKKLESKQDVKEEMIDVIDMTKTEKSEEIDTDSVKEEIGSTSTETRKSENIESLPKKAVEVIKAIKDL